jgi:hypothetical protein
LGLPLEASIAIGIHFQTSTVATIALYFGRRHYIPKTLIRLVQKDETQSINRSQTHTHAICNVASMRRSTASATMDATA